eukprot:TRINITY_DN12844_c0_g1_i6.p3 TRINITY_DN12844_c0_g1~~TRINITY_DN12844_c0_g1_i6.p3  ORF type:complete len:115 (-),score=30.06 TRINITY_DN12844_c0_g1_i6:987-1331(-)
MDLVLFDGDAKMMPWEAEAKKLGMLFQQCKKENKPLWASGSGMQMLVYYCATGYRKMNVVCSTITNKSLRELKKNKNVMKDPYSAVLDSQTGDYFSFDTVTSRLTFSTETPGFL